MARMPDGYVLIVESDGKEWRLKKSRELVMCKNCEFYGEEPIGTLMECYRGCGWTEPNDYCSRAKRRESE
jgi:hypothetical protein